MHIEKTIELPTGTIRFEGEVTEEELDHIITMGLAFMYIRGDIDASIMTEDGTLVADVPDQIQ